LFIFGAFMKKTVVSLSFLALSAAALGQSAPVAPSVPEKAAEPDLSVSYNVGLVSDYRYRGISQSRLAPALQGGADVIHKNGLYLGTWASTIKWTKDAGQIAGVDTGSNQVEMDIYGGYKGEIAKDVTYDVGFLQYWYPGNKTQATGGANANTLEAYGAVTSGPLTIKYSHALSNTFGFADTAASKNSKGSGYLDISTSFELTKGLTLAPHIGRQVIANFSQFSYTDYALALSKEFDGGFVASATAVSTNARNDLPGYAYASPGNKNLGKAGLVLGLKKNF
jgi:uncharacterized protein (TIGR02001 family)